MRKAKRENPDDIVDMEVRNAPPINPNSWQTEMELFGLTATRVARDIMEELGASCSGTQENDDNTVEGSENPHETIDDVRGVLARGESLARMSWGTNAKDNRCYYVVDSGHTVTVKPKSKSGADKDAVERIQLFLDIWMRDNCWNGRQAEVSQRLDRHGEVFDILYYDPNRDSPLQLSFAEPVDLDDDSDSEFLFTEDSDKKFVDDLGVRRTNDILYRPVSYFIDGTWYEDLTRKSATNKIAKVPRNKVLIQHRKRNVLSNDPRGITLYWPVRDELTWAKKLLSNLMRVSSFQAAFGAIRTISAAATADQVKAYLGTIQSGAANTGQSEKYDFPSAAVVTVPASIKYEFPETGAGASNHIEVLLNLLRAAAAGMKLPEFMLTANVSEGNFASTLVSEGPFHKGMRYEQNLMVEEDLRILWQLLRFAAKKGLEGISDTDLDGVTLEIGTPRVQTRNRKEDFEVNMKMFDKSVLSRKTLAASEDRDDDAEQAQIEVERKDEFPAPIAVSGPPTTSGPVPGIAADPLKEKGVMSGEPTDDPLKE